MSTSLNSDPGARKELGSLFTRSTSELLCFLRSNSFSLAASELFLKLTLESSGVLRFERKVLIIFETRGDYRNVQLLFDGRFSFRKKFDLPLKF